MHAPSHFLRLLACAATLACGTLAAHAQTARTNADTGNSFIPATQQGYIGLNAGQSKYDLRNGTSLFNFDDSDTGWKLYTGGYFHPNFGVEFGYLNFGKASRLGGDTKAQGLNFSLVGRAPIGDQFDVFGKLGTTYGRTRTSGNPGFGVATGKDDGFGLSYGAGVRWAFNPQWAAVLEWERHRLHFADGKSDVDMTTLGVQYRY